MHRKNLDVDLDSRLSLISEIPNKLYFKIGEVSQLVEVQPHVLRYWEKEVTSIRPGKTASNQRRYRRQHVEFFREVRRLLYVEKYTLAGVRKFISNDVKSLCESKNISDSIEIKSETILNKKEPQLSLGFGTSYEERMSRIKTGLQELADLALQDVFEF